MISGVRRRTRKRHDAIPRSGRTGILPILPGTLNGRISSGERKRRRMTDRFTIMNVTKIVKFVTFAINPISPAKRKRTAPDAAARIAR